MYTVHDAKAEAYLQPFFQQARGAAIRSFTDAVNRPDHSFSQHPEDYTLFECGEFNDQTGIITMAKVLTPLGCAIEYIKQQDLPLHSQPNLTGVS